MICRIWHGWTTRENAAAYEDVVRGQVIPGIEARAIPGFRHIDLMRREAGGEVEFQTLMWFDDRSSIRAFMGEDYAASHVPEAARAVLSRFDARAAHYEVIERREQGGQAQPDGLVAIPAPSPRRGEGGVRGSGVRRAIANARHAHPTLSLEGEGC